MAQTLDSKAAIKYAPKDLQPFLESTTKGTKFKLFLAADNWNKKPQHTSQSVDPGTDWRKPSGQGKHFDWPSRAL